MDYITAPEHRRTDRVLLRSWLPGDGPALREAVNASYTHLKPYIPWAVPDQDLDTSERLVRQYRGQWLLGQGFFVALLSPDGARVLGGGSYHPEGPSALGVAELGMWIRADASGQGLGTHVLETMVAWGFAEWPWQRLVWKCDAENLASRRCAEKAGLELEAVTRSDSLENRTGQRRSSAWYAVLRPTLSAQGSTE
jgi:RimJ/RimL family protein N-acetyltransferase